MRRLLTIALGGFALLITVHAPVHGQTNNSGARQAAGLFMQACVRFAGNKDGLRAFLSDNHVPRMKPEAVGYFVPDNHRGLAYDASNSSGRLAVASYDDGTCTVFSDTADGDRAVSAVQDNLRGENIEFEQIEDKLDYRDNGLRHRGYNANFRDIKWLLVLSTSSVANKMHVIFTASPRP